MLDEEKIKDNCLKLGFSYNYFGNMAIITTGVDQWSLESVEVYNKHQKDYVDGIKLRHKNIKGNKTGKAHYHTQRYVNNIDYAFKTITSHEENSRDFNKIFEIKNILSR